MLLEPNCYKRKCINYTGVSQPDGTERTEVNVCEAFPKGIPNLIAYGEHPHLTKFKGQTNDILYEK